MSSYIDVNEATFERDVIERSHETPVVVDFWAEWCAPCRALGPVLEKLAGEANGDWVLAKLDVDSNQRLAGAFGIQGIPAVKAFKDGRVVAEFTGALPEPQVRSWLQRLGPSEADRIYEAAATAERSGALEQARDGFEKALFHDPGHGPARAALARVELALRVSDMDEASLRARLDADPADVDTACGLADLLAATGDMDGSFAVMLDSVRATLGDDRERARLHLLSLLDMLPADDGRAIEARRGLSLALF